MTRPAKRRWKIEKSRDIFEAVNPEFQPLADAIERDRFVRARRMTLEQRLVQSTALFDYACQASLAGLRSQFPAATEAELQERLRQRIKRARELDTFTS